MFGSNVRRTLVLLPIALSLFLLQSALWVPTYGAQARGNPARLTTYIEASIGDAKILNPILAADAASMDVLSNRVTDGLVDADENLRLRPALAERWETTEEAYLAEIPERRLPDGRPATAEALLDALRAAFDGGLRELAPAVERLELEPASERADAESVVRPNKEGKPQPYDIKYRVRVPARVKLTLRRVVPELFRKLEPALGAGYFQQYPFESRFALENPADLAELRPKLPELLPVGEHNPIVTFFLRRGVRFHDGRPFTARDVRFTFQAATDPKNASPRASSFEPIRRVDIVDDFTARVVYKRLYSPALIDWSLGILPEHLLNAAAMKREMDRRQVTPDARKTFSLRNAAFNRSPIGTGPYRFVEWRPEQYIHLRRYEGYWGKKPEYRDIYMRVIPDYVAQELEFQAGAIDVYRTLPHQGARYRKDDDYQVMSGAEGYYTYIGYNLRRPLFKDIRVRKALGLALDVDSIIKYVLYGEGKRTSGPYYSHTPYYDPETPLLPYDPKGALELFRQAGWVKNQDGWLAKDGKVFEFTLITNNANPQRAAILTVAQAAWRSLGIRCNTRTFEWTVYLKDFIEPGEFDAYVLGWVGGDIDPDKYQIWHSSQTDQHELNRVGYANREADSLIERIREEYDPDAQIALARRLHRLIAADHPYTFLYEPKVPFVFDKKIVSVQRTEDGREIFSKLRPSPAGQVGFYFDTWRKLSALPSFARD